MGVTPDLGLRLPEVEWSLRSGRGDLEKLDWVDTRLSTELPPMRVVGEEGEARFRHYAYLTVVPDYIAEVTTAAQDQGRPTAWEALTLLFARPEWLVASRNLLWSPHSAQPGVLARMVEAFGVERTTHRYDPARLARLAAMLPAWYPGRGGLGAAKEVLTACDELATSDPIWGAEDPPAKEALQSEVLCCRSAKWWRARQSKGAQPVYRIQDGFLRFQPTEGEGFAMRREDYLVCLGDDGKLSLPVHRLLPAWASIRLTTFTEPPTDAPMEVEVELLEEEEDGPVLQLDPVDGDDATQEALVPMDELELLGADDDSEEQDDDYVLELEEAELEPIADITIVPDEDEDVEDDETLTDVPAPTRGKTPKGKK